jgi:hypothetical protein
VKIVLYGVSRAGKNYFIDILVKHLNALCINTLEHIDGSSILKKLSQQKYKLPIKKINETQKNTLRLAFCDELNKINDGYKNIIVDGHYAFYRDNIYEIAFTEKDAEVYDIFFYLDVMSKDILKHASMDAIKKDVAFMSEEKIDAWKNFEINGLRKACYEHGKEFVVLDNNIEDSLAYFETLLLNKYHMSLNARSIAQEMLRSNQRLVDRYKKVILLDCDRTLSNNDTTYSFCEKLGIGKSALKDIFRGERYSLYQFFRAAKLYASMDYAHYNQAASYAASKAVLNQSLIDDIQKNGANYLCFGITSGILAAWRFIQICITFPQIIAGGSNIGHDTLLVSREVKYWLTSLLQEQGKQVIAVGDSMVDIDMLETADKGFIIAQEKLNINIQEYLSSHNSRITQIVYSPFQYEGVNTQRSIFE